MGGNSIQGTRVRIYNQSYDLRGNDPEQIERLARFVDQKMSEVAEFTPTVDTAKVAILTALNIADQYFETLEKLERMEDAIGETGKRIAEKIASSGEVDSA